MHLKPFSIPIPTSHICTRGSLGYEHICMSVVVDLRRAIQRPCGIDRKSNLRPSGYYGGRGGRGRHVVAPEHGVGECADGEVAGWDADRVFGFGGVRDEVGEYICLV